MPHESRSSSKRLWKSVGCIAPTSSRSTTWWKKKRERKQLPTFVFYIFALVTSGNSFGSLMFVLFAWFNLSPDFLRVFLVMTLLALLIVLMFLFLLLPRNAAS